MFSAQVSLVLAYDILRAEHIARASFPLSGNLSLACIFFRSNRQRIDVDNMLKNVSDAATGIVWQDDSQVTAVAGTVEYDPSNPRTVIAIGRHQSTLLRGNSHAICDECGHSFLKRKSHQRLCGEACRMQFQRLHNVERRKHVHLPCEKCGGKTSKPGVLLCRPCWASRMAISQ